MKPNFIFHIGMPKAASTTFQRHLRGCKDSLKEIGIGVVDGSVGSMASDLEESIAEGNEWAYTEAAQMCNHLTEDGMRTILVTSEGLSHAPESFVADVGQWLASRASKTSLLLGYRDTFDWAVSAWQQGVRRGETPSLEESARFFLGTVCDEGSRESPENVASRWCNYLSATAFNSCRVSGYSQVPGGPLAEGFAALLDPAIASNLASSAYPHLNAGSESVFASNTSGSLFISEILRRINETLPTSISFLREMGLWDSEPAQLTPHLAEQLERRVVETEGDLVNVLNQYWEVSTWPEWALVDSRIEVGLRIWEAEN